MAALIKVEIDAYKRIAGFDISKNPGITATLYNLGDAATRARELKATNDSAARPRASRRNCRRRTSTAGWSTPRKPSCASCCKRAR